jgi:long-chain acyl-CoA synthetase
VDVAHLIAGEISPAPCAVLGRLPSWRDRPRFRLPRPDGPDQTVTWGELGGAIRAAAAWLCDLGLAPGDRAAILAANSVQWAAAALGVQAAGGVLVPIYPSSTAEQVTHVLQHSAARVVFVGGAEPMARCGAARASCAGLSALVALDDEAARVEPSATPWAELVARGGARDREEPRAVDDRLAAIDLDRPALLLYTSGTSGPPKGVPLTHRNVGVNARDWLACNSPLLPEEPGGPDDESGEDLLWLPMSHIFGLGELCLGNTLGWTSTLATPAEVLELLPRVRPSVFMSVPAYWDKLAGAIRAAPDRESRRRALAAATGGRLRFCLSGGAGLPREVKELFHDAGVLIVEGYGLTECSPTLTLNRPDAFRFDTVGLPLPSVELRLDHDGEILARGPSVFAGYHEDPAATAAAFTDDGWFRTGDIGRFTAEGFLQIVDRKKDILVTAGGKNVAPLNIELRFAGDPLISHLVVHGDGKRFLVAAVWIDPAVAEAALGPDHGPEDLAHLVQTRIDAVNVQLARFETIKRFCIIEQPLTVESGLLTASLKLRRKQIYARFARELEALHA